MRLNPTFTLLLSITKWLDYNVPCTDVEQMYIEERRLGPDRIDGIERNHI